MSTEVFDLYSETITAIEPEVPALASHPYVRIVFSDLVTAEFRARKSDPEFPTSLDSLDVFLHRKGWDTIDYAFLFPVATQQEMRYHGKLLHTLGVRGQKPYPVKQADIWGINVMNYLQAPALFSLLQLAGVPALRAERDTHFPIIILGGHIWPNPLPLSHFYDVMVIGDGEEALHQIAELRAQIPSDKDRLLEAISNLEGTFVPGYTAVPAKRVSIDFQHDTYASGSSYLLNRVGAVVLARGCPHSCAFCNNTFIGGQYRVKPYTQIMRHIDRLKHHGAKKVMLVAATASCYRSEGKTAFDVMAYIKQQGMRVRSMSDRPEFFTEPYLRQSAVERGKVVLALESSPRIRTQVLRKALQEITLEQAVSAAIAAGIHHIQLYIILALPPISPKVVDFLPDGFSGEQEEDLEYLTHLGMSIARRMRKANLKQPEAKPYVKLDCMPFVPAIGTRLQRVAFPSYQAYQRSISRLRALISDAYRDVVEVTAGMDRITYLLQVFLERNNAESGIVLWNAWKRAYPASLDVNRVSEMIADAGYSESALRAEFLEKSLPYKGLIKEEHYGKDGNSTSRRN